jgi:hypothetical protein
MSPVVALGQSPSVTVGGVSYAQYVYQLKDTANHLNYFDVTRAYINVLGRFDVLATRVTPDIYRVADGSLAFRLKYAYATYTPKGSALTYKLGQLQTPWVDFEETLWDYRMQGQIALERGDIASGFSYLSSSDFGAGIDGKWQSDRVNMQFTFVNGEGYSRGPGDQRKDVMGRVSVRLMNTDDSSRTGGLRLSAYGQYGKPTGGGMRRRALGMLSYRSRLLTVAAEVAATADSVTAPLAARRNGRVVTLFGVYRFPSSGMALIGRVDVTDPNTATPNNRFTRLIVGASYRLTPNLRLLADVDHVTYENATPTPALEAVRSQALLQVQFTF